MAKSRSLHHRARHHLKHWLVPHKHNDHRPHLIRRHGLALFVAVILAVQGTAYAARATSPVALQHGAQGHVLAYATDINPVDLLSQTNAQRTANGLPPLRLSAKLNQSAQFKAQNMFAENYWAHVSPSGIQPWHWFTQAGYGYSYAGENLAKDFDTTSGTMEGWMNSPGHRANILNEHYTEVGFAVMNGTLVGGETTLVVAHYGAPTNTTVAATVPAPTKKPASTPVPTPIVTPTPVATTTPAPVTVPSVTPAPSLVAATGQITEAPPPKAYSLFAPLTLTRTLDWNTLVTLLLLLLLFLVYVATHLAVWRKGLRRWRTLHYRAVATTQVTGLATLMLYLAASGLGRVG